MSGKDLTCVDLFSGAGGLTLGLHQAGWVSVLAVERDYDSVQTYRRNFPEVPVEQKDIRDIDLSELSGKVRLVAGGPPCQPFSVAGFGKAHRDERDMLPRFVSAVRQVKPSAFLLENVPGLLTPRHEGYLRRIQASLEDLGYTVSKAVLDAAGF